MDLSDTLIAYSEYLNDLTEESLGITLTTQDVDKDEIKHIKGVFENHQELLQTLDEEFKKEYKTNEYYIKGDGIMLRNIFDGDYFLGSKTIDNMIRWLCQSLRKHDINFYLDDLILNRYYKNDSCPEHSDDLCSNKAAIIVSLGCTVNFQFESQMKGNDKCNDKCNYINGINVKLDGGDVFIFDREYDSKYTHQIRNVSGDRISLVFFVECDDITRLMNITELIPYNQTDFEMPLKNAPEFLYHTRDIG